MRGVSTATSSRVKCQQRPSFCPCPAASQKQHRRNFDQGRPGPTALAAVAPPAQTSTLEPETKEGRPNATQVGKSSTEASQELASDLASELSTAVAREAASKSAIESPAAQDAGTVNNAAEKTTAVAADESLTETNDAQSTTSPIPDEAAEPKRDLGTALQTAEDTTVVLEAAEPSEKRTSTAPTTAKSQAPDDPTVAALATPATQIPSTRYHSSDASQTCTPSLLQQVFTCNEEDHCLPQGMSITLPSSQSWQSVPLYPQHNFIESYTPENGALSGAPPELCCLAPMTEKFGGVVLQLEATNALLQAGTLKLPPNVALVLDSTCNDVQFQDLTFTGGFPIVCHGKGCNVSFRDVNFDDCTLVALSGSHVSLESTEFVHETPLGSNISIFAEGTGTRVWFHDGFVGGGVQGAVVQQGARFEASDVTFEDIVVTGVLAQHESTSVALTGCTMQQFSPQYSHLNDGLWAHSHATASLRQCNFAHAGRSCVFASEGSTTDLHDCVMLESATGLLAVDNETQVQASSCHFLQNTDIGVHALAGASISADSCRSMGNEPAGYATRGAQMHLRSCSSADDGIGCVVSEGGQLLAELVHVSGAFGNGFECEGAGRMDLKLCTATSCVTHGVFCNDEALSGAAVVRAVGCTMQVNEQSGFVAGNGADMTLKACCSRQNKDAGLSATHSGVVNVIMSHFDDNTDGMWVEGNGKLTVTDCDVAGNSGHGILVEAYGKATIQGSSVTTSEQYGILVRSETARIDVDQCSVEGNEVDADAQSFGILNVVDCEGIESMNNLLV